MDTSLISTVVLIAALGAADPESSRRSIFENPGDATPRGKIDELVFGQLQQLGIPPARLCSDSVFVRRVYLDAIGTLPTAEEAKEFLADR